MRRLESLRHSPNVRPLFRSSQGKGASKILVVSFGINQAELVSLSRKLLDENSRFLVLTVYAIRMSALAIGELVKQTLGELGGTVEMGEMAVREEARGLLLPTAIFARWSKS